MSTDSRRLSILTAQEVDDLYGLPRFTEEDRRLYFALSPSERDLVDGVYTISVAVHLILQLGYFKAKRQFFVYAREAVTEDLEHILRRHFPTPEMADIKGLSKPTRLEQQQVILKLFGYQLCDTAAKSELEQKAKRVAMLSTQPIFILREVLQYLTNQRIVAPGYTYLQDMVGRTVSGERRRITALLGQALTAAVEHQLEALLQADEGMYRISLLKHEPKDFSYGELRHEVERRTFFQSDGQDECPSSMCGGRPIGQCIVSARLGSYNGRVRPDPMIGSIFCNILDTSPDVPIATAPASSLIRWRSDAFLFHKNTSKAVSGTVLSMQLAQSCHIKPSISGF
jgi:hypothetical protein